MPLALKLALPHPAGASASAGPGLPRRDDAQALLAGLTRGRGRFVAFVRRRVPSDADAEDIVQQGFARAAEKVAELRDGRRIEPWFYRILRRLIADGHARRALGARKLDELAATLQGATPEETASCACALGLLDSLRPDYADILKRVDLDDQSLDQAALALGITANNAGVRLHRARARLRADVEALCGAPGAAAARQACADCDC